MIPKVMWWMWRPPGVMLRNGPAFGADRVGDGPDRRERREERARRDQAPLPAPVRAEVLLVEVPDPRFFLSASAHPPKLKLFPAPGGQADRGRPGGRWVQLPDDQTPAPPAASLLRRARPRAPARGLRLLLLVRKRARIEEPRADPRRRANRQPRRPAPCTSRARSTAKASRLARHGTARGQGRQGHDLPGRLHDQDRPGRRRRLHQRQPAPSTNTSAERAPPSCCRANG